MEFQTHSRIQGGPSCACVLRIRKIHAKHRFDYFNTRVKKVISFEQKSYTAV